MSTDPRPVGFYPASGFNAEDAVKKEAQGVVIKNAKGERFKLCVSCSKPIDYRWSAPECPLCMINRDEGGSG